MPARLAADRDEAVQALTLRYVLGELSEPTYMVSLHRYLDVDDIRHLVILNQVARRNSIPYRKGIIQ